MNSFPRGSFAAEKSDVNEDVARVCSGVCSAPLERVKLKVEGEASALVACARVMPVRSPSTLETKEISYGADALTEVSG